MAERAETSTNPGNVLVDEKTRRSELLRDLLPECQPQEGSPANTFTPSEVQELKTAMTDMTVSQNEDAKLLRNTINISEWSTQGLENSSSVVEEKKKDDYDSLEWHGAPRIEKDCIKTAPRAFREEVRAGGFRAPTNGMCPGFLQCNLVVLPQGPQAFDFLLFCQRNKKACPLVEVCDVGSPFPNGVARGADLRTDIPKYAIYRNGVLEKEVDDVTEYWPENSVAFLIGCSFSYDGALLDAGINLRSAEQGKNVPMYRTNLKCRSSGSLHGNMVVSMKPIRALDVAKEVEITSKYPLAHGAPVCVGSPDSIGIADINKPDWGDAVEVQPDEVPVFHACGVTPQNILMDCKVPFAITHSPGHMFISDLPSDVAL